VGGRVWGLTGGGFVRQHAMAVIEERKRLFRKGPKRRAAVHPPADDALDLPPRKRRLDDDHDDVYDS
jgi:hypothetical protein